MKKRFSLENLDCANCARKMEEACNKLDGVVECKINFMSQKFVLEADEDKFDQVFEACQKECRKVERDLIFK